jgi:hypothetical protein
MTITTTYTQNTSAEGAARELATQLAGFGARFVLFFASPDYDVRALGTALRKAFGDVPSLGCTTAGEIITGQMLKNSVVLMGFDSEELRTAHVAAVQDMQNPDSVDQAVETLATSVGSSPHDLDPGQYLGLILHDGLSVAEENVMGRLGDLTNIPFVGGSAGDNARFEATHVFVDFEPRQNISGIALLEPTRPYHILKTQSFDVTDTVLTVTDVDEATRTVHSFDDRPAAEAYAEAVGVTTDRLPERFQDSPLGLVMGDGEPFVRSPQQIKGTDVVFYCQVKKGMRLHVLRARDIVQNTQRDLQAKLDEIGGARAAINFHCILRTLELHGKEQEEPYGKVFAEVPTVGFSTYGESYIGHINQTSTIVLFG